MSNQRKKQELCKHPAWEKSEHVLVDGFSYYYLVCKNCHEVMYPGDQLQKIQNYSKDNLFLFVPDWVLLLLYAGHDYIAGITRYQKMLFLIFKEKAPELKIPSENPGFYGYLYGPFSARIDEAIEFLIKRGYIRTEGIRSSSLEHFYLTDIGKDRAKRIFDRLSKEQQENLREFRQYWDTKSIKAICKRIYVDYKEYTTKSIILTQLFPGRKLHRMRHTAPKVTELWKLGIANDEASQET
jgi:uncharacterized protein YwgA